jgi:hypothetical protein
VIPVKCLEQVRADIAQEFGAFGASISESIINMNSSNKPLLHELHKLTCNLLSLNRSFQQVLELANNLLGCTIPFIRSSGYLLGIPKDNRLVYDFHQESNYMKDFKQICNIHFPIMGKADLNNGTMSVLEKSHKLGNLNYTESRVSNDSYTNYVPMNIQELTGEFEEVHLELNLGDCIFFHGDLIHKSNFNGSNLCRLAGIVRLASGAIPISYLKSQINTNC